MPAVSLPVSKESADNYADQSSKSLQAVNNFRPEKFLVVVEMPAAAVGDSN